MKKLSKINNLYKKFIIISIIIMLSFVFIKQEKELISYKKEQRIYEDQIIEQKEKQKKLNDTKSNVNSKEYIEEIAREKLDMYLPNERIYIDKCK